MADTRTYVPGVTTPLITADELLRNPIPNKRTELVRGRLIVREPAGSRHGIVAMNIGVALANHVKRADAGFVFAAETGFMLAANPDTVRAGDVAFVAPGRLDPHATRGFAALAPDLVVEVLSPDDRPGEVLAKAGDWLEAGTRLVWLVDPVRHSARVYRYDGSVAVVQQDGSLDGEDVVPEFSCPLATIW